MGNHQNCKTEIVGICTPLISVIYFRFVSEKIDFKTIKFPSDMQNLVKIGKELRT